MALGNFIEQSPSYRGDWMPVYLEPIYLSGERLTIAIAAVGHDNQFKLHPTLTDKQLKCLYGESWKNINGLIQLTIGSLSAHLKAGNALQNWQTIDGVYKGRLTQAKSTDLDGIVNQGIRMTASMATPIETSCEESNEDEQQQTFKSAVRSALLQLNPDYKPCLDREIALNDNRPRYYNFVTARYIANYAAIANNGHSLNAAFVKIMDLEDLALDHFTQFERLEMIVSPPIGFLESAEKSTLKNQKDLMEQTLGEAKKRDIRCKMLETPVEIANYLHRQAA